MARAGGRDTGTGPRGPAPVPSRAPTARALFALGRPGTLGAARILRFRLRLPRLDRRSDGESREPAGGALASEGDLREGGPRPARRTGRVDPARTAGPGDARASLCLGPASLGDRSASARQGGSPVRVPPGRWKRRKGEARALRRVGSPMGPRVSCAGAPRPRSPPLAGSLSLDAWRRDDATAILAIDRAVRARRPNPGTLDAALPATLLRDAPARARSRPARPPDDARPLGHRDDAGLHPGFALAPARGL
jgi:hypothetical protein